MDVVMRSFSTDEFNQRINICQQSSKRISFKEFYKIIDP